MNKWFLFLATVFTSTAIAQNLVPNPDFEQYSVCPVAFDDFGVDIWINPIAVVTPDYFNSCSVGVMGVPTNMAGFQASLTGDAYIGLVNYLDNLPEYREYVVAELTSPLQAGCYHLEISYSHADEGGFSNGLGMYLSVGIPASYSGLIPQMENVVIDADQDNWLTIELDYYTTGGETHVSIGNFRDDSNTSFIMGTGLEPLYGYTYIDFISVEACPLVCDANAGFLNVASTTVCPSATISFEVFDYNATFEYQQSLIVTNEFGQILDVIEGGQGEFSYNKCGEFRVYSYNYKILGSSITPVVGDLISDFECVVSCCELVSEIIVFEDDSPPVFSDIPEHPNSIGGISTKIYCVEDIPLPQSITYDDNCLGHGTIAPVDSNMTSACNGGEYIRTWELYDSCSLMPTIAKQVILIEPIPIAEFIDPPNDTTVTCDCMSQEIDLFYSNGLTNSCNVSGKVSPFTTRILDICGGIIIHRWIVTDSCNRVTQHTQTITVEKANEPVFINPPKDTTISCEDIPTTGKVLVLSNNSTSDCLITQEVVPTIINNYNNCGGEIFLEWKYTDSCGINYVNTQTIHIVSTTIIEFTDLPIPISVTCEGLESVETKLNYTNTAMGSCAVTGYVEALQVGTVDECGGSIAYIWEYDDGCGQIISHSQTINVLSVLSPIFIDIPQDTIVSCGVVYKPAILEYTNMMMANCSINGFVEGEIMVANDSIFVEWKVESNCDNSFIITRQLVEERETHLEIIDFILECDDNNTDEVLIDDNYNVVFKVQSAESGKEYSLMVNNIVIGVYEYDESYQIVFPADNISLVVTFIDNETGCTIERSTLLLEPCSSSCDKFPNATIFVSPSNVLDCAVRAVELSSIGETNIDYHWMFNSVPLLSSELVLDQEGQVILIAIDTVSGCKAQDTIDIVDIEAYPLVNIADVDPLTCIDTTTILDGSNSSNGNQYNYYWLDNNNLYLNHTSVSIIEINEPGWYFLEVTDINIGCVNIDSVYVEEIEMSWSVDLPKELLYLENELNALQAVTNIDLSMIESISWTPEDHLSCTDCLDPILLDPSISSYQLTVRDTNGCVSIARINILFEEKIDIFVPTIFSPSSMNNNHFTISIADNLQLYNLELSIYSRWGELIYSKDQLQELPSTAYWDGTYKGELLDSGVYLYKYRAVLKNHKEIVKVGNITIVR